MRRVMMLSAAVVLLMSAIAQAQVPNLLGYQGRLYQDGAPATGLVQLTFKIFDAATAGNPVFSEQQTLGLSDGYYATFIGQNAPLEPSDLDGDRWLEITVGTQVLSPRQKIGSTAYALRAAVADTARSVLGGSVNATSISVAGKTIVDASGALTPAATAGLADAASLSTPGTVNAPTNPVDWTKLKNVPPGFLDGTDDGLLTVAVGAGLSGSGTAADAVKLNLSVGAGLVGNGTAASPLQLAATAPVTPSTTGVYPRGPRPIRPWTRVNGGAAVLAPTGTGFDSANVRGGSVIKVNGTFRMYYSGSGAAGSQGIGLATSTDGLTWTRSPANPLIQRGAAGQADAASVQGGTVIHDGAKYVMAYDCADGNAAPGTGWWRICGATSTDGLAWAKSGVIVDRGPSGAWDSGQAEVTSMTFENGKYTLWYSGFDGTGWRIGMARSNDGTIWQKVGTGPVLGGDAGGESGQAAWPTVIKVGRTWYMQYSQVTSAGAVPRLATSADGVTWTYQSYLGSVAMVSDGNKTSFMICSSMLVDGDTVWGFFSGVDTRWSISAWQQDASE